MPEARHLLTWFGTLLFVDEADGVVRHGPLDGSPRNLLLLPGVGEGPARLVLRRDGLPDAEHAFEDCGTLGDGLSIVQDPALRTFGLQAGERFLCFRPDGSHWTLEGSFAEWERLLPIAPDELDTLAALMRSGWYLPRTDLLVRRRDIKLDYGCQLFVGPMHFDLRHEGFPLMVRESTQAEGRQVVRELALLRFGWMVERALLFNPLIYFTVFRQDHFFACLRHAVESLERIGGYEGSYLMITDRSREAVEEYFGDVAPERLLYRHHDPRYLEDIASARRELDRERVAKFQPVLYMDTDIVSNASADPLLTAVLRQDRLFFATEFPGVPVSEAPDSQADWFGRFLHREDADWDSSRMMCVNSGMIGGRNVDLMLRPFEDVAYVWAAHNRYHGRKYHVFLDQPFIGYVLQKMGLADVSTFDTFAECVKDVDPGPRDPRRGFVHFNSGVGKDKSARMHTYVEALRREPAPPPPPPPTTELPPLPAAGAVLPGPAATDATAAPPQAGAPDDAGNAAGAAASAPAPVRLPGQGAFAVLAGTAAPEPSPTVGAPAAVEAPPPGEAQAPPAPVVAEAKPPAARMRSWVWPISPFGSSRPRQ